MQEVASELGFWRGPIRLLMVFVLAHHKNMDGPSGGRSFGGKLVLHAFEQVVVPVNDDSRGRELEGFVAELNVADAPPKAGVPADLYQQALTVARRVGAAVRLDPHVIPERAIRTNVVPATDMQCRDLNVWKVLLDGPLLPVRVIRRMREPIEIIGRDLGGGRGACGKCSVIKRRILRERQCGSA